MPEDFFRTFFGQSEPDTKTLKKKVEALAAEKLKLKDEFKIFRVDKDGSKKDYKD